MTTVLVSGAGGSGSNNLIRGLRRISPPVRLVGTNADRFSLARSTADVNYLLPYGSRVDEYLPSLRRVIEAESIDLVIPNSDTESVVLATHREQVPARLFLPTADATLTLRDKASTARKLEAGGVRVAATRIVEELDALPRYFDELGNPDIVWCRQRRASGSRGSLPVYSPQQARFWIEFWGQHRGVPHDEFTISEYLPGRDFACQSIWKDGQLLIAKTCERLEYLFGENMPSGTSSTPSVGRLCNDPRVNTICETAIPLLDARATGVFAMDLKEARDGWPCVTEINNGRFFQITPAFNEVGRHNMAEIYVRLALGESYHVEPERRFSDIGAETTYLLRATDQPLALMTESEMGGAYHTPDPNA